MRVFNDEVSRFWRGFRDGNHDLHGRVCLSGWAFRASLATSVKRTFCPRYEIDLLVSEARGNRPRLEVEDLFRVVTTALISRAGPKWYAPRISFTSASSSSLLFEEMLLLRVVLATAPYSGQVSGRSLFTRGFARREGLPPLKFRVPASGDGGIDLSPIVNAAHPESPWRLYNIFDGALSATCLGCAGLLHRQRRDRRVFPMSGGS